MEPHGSDRRRHLNCTIGPKELKRLDRYSLKTGKPHRSIMCKAINAYLNRVTKSKLPLETNGKYAHGRKWTYPNRAGTDRGAAAAAATAFHRPGSITEVRKVATGRITTRRVLSPTKFAKNVGVVILDRTGAQIKPKLTSTQLDFLLAASAASKQTLQTISKKAHLLPSSTSTIANTLTAKGWIKRVRSKTDRRQSLITTTAKARKLVERINHQR